MMEVNEADEEWLEMIEERLREERASRITEEMMEQLEAQTTADESSRNTNRAKRMEKRIRWWRHLVSCDHFESDFEGEAKFFEDVFRMFFPVSGERAFVSIVGVKPHVMGLMWMRYSLDFEELGVTQLDLMLTMSFLTTNLTYDALAAIWCLGRTKYIDVIKTTLSNLYDILDEVSWKKLPWHRDEVTIPEGNMFHGATFILDGIECGIAKPSDKVEDAGWFSGKAGEHTVKYETGVHIASGRIMWVSGGISGSINDISLTKTSGLLDIIPPGEIGLCDKGYNGLPKDQFLVMLKKRSTGSGNARTTHPLTTEEAIFNRLMAALRIEVERVNGRLKRFSILWRSRVRDRFSHGIMFNVLCNVVNIQMELEPMRREMHQLLFHCPFAIPRRARPD